MRIFNYLPLISEKAKGGPSSNCCLLCNRKLGKNPAYVRVVNGGGFLAHHEDLHLIDEMSDLGTFEIGPECKKRIPVEFVRKELR